MSKLWTKEEDEQLRQLYLMYSCAEIAEKLKRTVFSIRVRANERGLSTKQRSWIKEEDAIMIAEYSTLGRREIARKLNRTEPAVQRRAIHLGVKISGAARTTLRSGSNSPLFRGHEEIPAHYLASMRVRARSRDLRCEITPSDIWGVYLGQNRRCRYSGRIVSFCDKTASVDRIDSSKGYVLDNIQIVHRNVNLMKIDLSESEFLFFIHAIAKQHA